MGIKPDKGEEVATASAGTPAQVPRDSATMDTAPAPTKTTTGVEGTQCPLDPRHLCEALGEMNNGLEHLERGYFDCFHEMVKATRDVLADINEINATYVDTVLTAMAKWQKDVTLMITDMYTDDCVVWDAKHNAIDEATQKFGETCEASHIKRAAAHEARQKAVVSGNEKDPVIELLDQVLVKTRKAACPGEGAKYLHEDRATPSSRAEGQPYGLSQLVGKYLGNSCTSDTRSASQSGTSSYAHSPTPAIAPLPGISALGVRPVPTTSVPVFRGVPLVSVPAGMVTGLSLFQTSLAPPPGFKMLPTSSRVTSTSSAPTAASTPKVSTSGIVLPVSIPLSEHPGGRSYFLTNAFKAGNLADLDEELNEDLRKMAGDVFRNQMAGSKHIHDEDVDEDKEAEDGNSSMFEDLDEPLPAPVKRSGKAKSPDKSGPVNWLPAEVDIVRQNRYAMDQSEMRDYRRNYLMAVDQKTFNLKNHSKDLDIILAKPGIMQDVVFTVEKGQVYFTEMHKAPTDLYDQGVLMPLPASPSSKRFPDKEVVAVIYVMVIVAHPSSQNIADKNPDGFGCTCLMGLWGLHTEKVLQQCRKTCSDGVN